MHDERRTVLGRGLRFGLASAGQVVAVAIALPLVTRALTPGEYGQVATGVLTSQVLAVVAGMGLPAAITVVACRGEPERARALVWDSVAVALGVATVAHLTGNTWASLLFDDLAYSPTMKVAVAMAAATATVNASQAALVATGRVAGSTCVALVQGVGGPLLGLTFVAVAPSPQAFLAGSAIGTTVAAVVGLRLVGPRPGSADRQPSASLRMALPTVPHGMALFALWYADRVVIEHAEGLGAVGRYQVAYGLGSLVLTALVALNNAWAPTVLQAPPEHRPELLASTTSMVAGLGAALASIAALASPVALAVMSPGTYRPEGTRELIAVTVLVVSCAVPYSLYLASVAVLFAGSRAGTLAWATPLVAAVNIALAAVLVGPLGLPGVAAATSTAYVLHAALVTRRSARALRIEWPWRTLRAAAGGVAAAGVAAVAPPTTPPWLAARMVAAGVIAAGLARTVGRTLKGRHQLSSTPAHAAAAEPSGPR